MEIHIFDFDGTLFFSPTPERRFVCAQYGARVLGKLFNPLSSSGYGWFQSLSTLSPPAVPAEPAESQWYITPVVNWFRALIAGKTSSCNENRDRQHQYVNSENCAHEHVNGDCAVQRLFFVLTGRQEGFRRRIEHLLDHVGLFQHIEHVFLKPHEGIGTAEYKLNIFFDLILKWKPQRVFYYEDRYDQAAKLLEGMEQLQSALNSCRESDTHLCSIHSLIDASVVKPGSCKDSSVLDKQSNASFLPSPHQTSEDSVLTHSISSVNLPKTMTREVLHGGDTNFKERVSRYIRNWLVNAIHERNSAFRQVRLSQLSAPPSGANNISKDVNIIHDTKKLYSAQKGFKPFHASDKNPNNVNGFSSTNIEFDPPLPFSFTMVIIPREISFHSDKMLSLEQQSALIATLMKERETYDALKFHSNGY
ncbi:unnamed protein product [Phytomonas sp. Hart1]|nr:unnamed protein product [Phytomonas sp. Hart1]|eukprot:CCW68316.1 unnamed protein product [Phytomonas sp. isolate Hart1]